MPMPRSDPHDLEWEDVSPADWIATVDAWPWTRRDTDEWFKSGPCPRCGHNMTVRSEGGVLAGLRYVIVDGAEDKVTAFCNTCSHTGHPETPSIRARGCGARGQIGPPA
jgi:hypothetical protein